MGFFKKLFGGLKKTATTLTSGIASIFTGGREFDDDFYDDLTAILLSADMGMESVEQIISDIKRKAKKDGIKTELALKEALAGSISNILTDETEDMKQEYPCIVLIVGVNGVGKTTAIGKLANYYKQSGKSVLLAAGDTFRAAASEQLAEWANRAAVRIIKHTEGADPASVVFDALTSFKAKKDDMLIIDTAGRLHNKAHLMEELKKIDRVIQRHCERDEVKPHIKKYIVLDATTGQNALSQVETFNNAVNLDGVILTKLDGTAKGGVVVAIKQQFNLPVVFVGVGEKLDDLLPFDPIEFSRALVGLE